MKERTYLIMMMLIYSEITEPGGKKTEIRMVHWEVVKFKYPEIVADH